MLPLQAALSKLDKTVDQANAQTNERNNDERKNQGIASDGTDIGRNPRDGASDHTTDIGNQGSQSVTIRALKSFHLS